MTQRGICRALEMGVLAIVLSAVGASAQVFTGRIEVVVNDTTGGVLPGVMVEISGPRKASAATAADGIARFLNLEPGVYEAKASLAGFQQYMNTDVPVVAGATMSIEIAETRDGGGIRPTRLCRPQRRRRNDVSGARSVVAMVMPKYQFAGNGLYRAPREIDVGLNVVLRQGYGQPWFRSKVPTGDPFSRNKTVDLYSDIDKNRLPTVATVDLRLGWNPAKAFHVTRVGVHVDGDVFNLFNSGTVLGRQYDQRLTGKTGFNQILEVMNPRIARLGLRFTF